MTSEVRAHVELQLFPEYLAKSMMEEGTEERCDKFLLKSDRSPVAPPQLCLLDLQTFSS